MTAHEKYRDYRRRLAAAPKVFATQYPCGSIDDFYGSLEAAQLEVDYMRRLKRRAPKIVSFTLHSLELSRERWG